MHNKISEWSPGFLLPCACHQCPVSLFAAGVCNLRTVELWSTANYLLRNVMTRWSLHYTHTADEYIAGELIQDKLYSLLSCLLDWNTVDGREALSSNCWSRINSRLGQLVRQLMGFVRGKHGQLHLLGISQFLRLSFHDMHADKAKHFFVHTIVTLARCDRPQRHMNDWTEEALASIAL